MAARTSSQAGNWSDTATWGGAAAPGNGDSATINHAVVVDTHTTVGTSGAAGTIDVTVDATGGNTGSLTIDADVVLTVRGDTSLKNAVLTLEEGSSYLFGNGGSSQIYKINIGSATSQASSKLVCNGISGNRCAIGIEAGAGTGRIGRFTSSASAWTQVRATYTDFSDLGAGGTSIGFGNDAIELNCNTTGLESHFSDCTFTRCSRIQHNAVAAAANLSWTNNTFRSATGTSTAKYLVWFTTAASPTGTRVVTNNDFYDSDQAVVFNSRDDEYVFDNNVYSKITYSSTVAGPGMASCENNIRINRVAGSGNTSELGSVGTTVLDCYCVIDTATEGRGVDHAVPSSGTGGVMTNDGCIYDVSTANEDADMWHAGSPSVAGCTSYHTRCIVLPNSRGYMSGAFTAHGGANLTIELEHNTMMSSQTTGSSTGDAAMYLGSGYAGHTNFLNKLRSNLIWNKVTPAGQGYISWDSSSTVDDIINVANVTKNASFNCRDGTIQTAAGAAGATVRGYHNFELTDQTIGSTDLILTGSDETTGGPKFVDSSRNFATFASAYLDETATAWADATAYSVGDVVSASDSSFYGGATILYRCVTAHTSATGHATNGKPSVAASYRTNWEFHSAHLIREAIVAGTTITDSALGLSNANYVAALVTWVRAGFAPRELTLQNAGHDGVTIGAVEGSWGGGSYLTLLGV